MDATNHTMALAAPANASAPAPAPAPPSLGPTFGVLYIGATLATVLYGFTTNQAFLYYKKYGSEDGIPTRLLVFVLWVLDSFQVALVINFIWFYLVSDSSNPALLATLVWSFCLELGITVLTTFIVRAHYLKQLWRLSGRRLWIVVPAFIFAAGQLGLGIQTTINMLEHPRIVIVMTKAFQWILGSKCATSVLADVIITSSMCYYLHVSRTGFRKTNDLVNALLVYTISRGVLGMLMEATVMITFLTMKNNFVFAALHLMLGKLHISSLFALSVMFLIPTVLLTVLPHPRLLQRDTLRSRQRTMDAGTFQHMVVPPDSDVAHTTSRHEPNTDIEVMITRETVVGHVYEPEDQKFSGPMQLRRSQGKRYPYSPGVVSW